MAEALLVRHSEATGSAPDAVLTERGRRQARALAELLAAQPIDGLASSPYRRAHETAAPLAELSQLPVTLDARLREWELPWIPPEQWPDALQPIFGGRARLPLDVEPREAARARGRGVLDEALARHGRSVLVTHGKLLALVLGDLQGRDPFDVFRDLRNAHVFEVRASPSGTEVRSLWYPP